MDNKQNIVYVMQYVDIKGHVNNIPYKKIGITTNVSNRLQQMNNTNSPLMVECVIAWRHDEALTIEKDLHILFDNIKSKGEWFTDENNTLIDEIKPTIEKWGAKEVDLEEDDKRMKILRKEKFKVLLDKIIDCLPPSLHNLKTSIELQFGPRISGNKSELTFYVYRKSSDKHHLSIGRISSEISKRNNVSDQLKKFLAERGFDECVMWGDEVVVKNLLPQQIADIINSAEAEFNPTKQ